MRTRISQKSIKNIVEAGYSLTYWEDYDYTFFDNIIIRTKKGKSKKTYADLIIMADTETSRKMENPKTDEDHHNHVCAWSCAFRSLGYNIVTLWGKKPGDLPKMLRKVRERLACDEMYVYFHNLPYDWVFERKFFFEEFSEPEHQLNVKPLYPLSITFGNGIILKDSLMLSQRSLEKWGADMRAEHAKAVGKWDYDAIRHFDSWNPSPDELLYMECDVLCGVECIDATMHALHKTISSIPLTATGIPRGECRNEGKKHKAHDWYVRLSPKTFAEQYILELAFHGGFTHANRFITGQVFPGYYSFTSPWSKCKDFSSSYPFCILAYRYPCERFWKLPRENVSADYILRNSEKYAFIFKMCARGVRLKNPRFPMPAISYSKCVVDINVVKDNGRILTADYIEIYLTEIDFMTIYDMYDFDRLELTEVQCALKDYLPRWFTDYVYSRYESKTKLKGVDPVLYAIEKAKVNSCYGMCAQKPVKPDIIEDYETGEFKDATGFDYEKEYQKHLQNRNSFLPYCIGVYVTSFAQFNLFRLGACVPDNEVWLYSDTDSVYATAFDEEKLAAYNKECMEILESRGYGGVEHKGKTYFLGIAEDDGEFMQFKALHSKCYCKRPIVAHGDNFVMGEDLKITVAGVPKRGAKSLKNNIDLFKEGFVFDGTTSGKLQHTHYFIPEIYIDEHGNETGDSIDLTPCDYLVNNIQEPTMDMLLETEIEMQDYEKEYTTYDG